MAGSGGKRKSTPKAGKSRSRASKAEQLPESSAADPVAEAQVIDGAPSDTAEGSRPEPEPGTSEAAQPIRPAVEKRRVWPAMLLGGILAGAAGFGASQYLGNDSWPFSSGPSKVELVETQLSAQSAQLARLQEKLDALAAAQPDLATTADLEQLARSLAPDDQPMAEMSARIDQLEARLTDLENRPIPDGNDTKDAVAAYERQLEAMRQMFQAELERIREAQASADAARSTAMQAGQEAAVQAALARLVAAADNGAPFGEALDELRAAGLDVPASLAAVADTGVATLAQLQSSFPDMARQALAASAAEAPETGSTGKIAAFLRRQLGARSLEPREGNDPDAVLSRAEAALKSGDLETTLRELQGLPDAGRKVLAPWVSKASQRQEVMRGIRILTEKLEERGQ